MDKQNERTTQNHSDFSIDHILNRAGNSRLTNSENCNNLDPFSWLHCTRYCPPKVPRSQRKEPPQKRQLGRHPRIPFSSYQLAILEEKFQESPYLSSEEVINLSRKLQLADIRVKIWFQNRRARERREKLGVNNSNQEIPNLNETKTTQVPIKYVNEEEVMSSSVASTSLQFVHSSNFGNFLSPDPMVHNYFEQVAHFVGSSIKQNLPSKSDENG